MAWLAYTYDLRKILEALKAAQYIYLVSLPIPLLTGFALRAIRWKLLFPNHAALKFRNLFNTMMVGYAFNNVMPARAGELIKIYLLSQVEKSSKSTALATVVLEKTADLLIVMALAACMLVFYPHPQWLNNIGLAMGFATVAAVGFLTALKFAGSRLMGWLARCTGFFSARLMDRVESAGQRFLAGITTLFSWSAALRFLVLSALIWLVELWIMYSVARSFNIDTAIGNLLFVMLVIALSTVVPSLPAYIGTFEFFGVSAFALVGVSGEVALSCIVVLHAITFLGSCLIGFACLVLLKVGGLVKSTQPESHS